MWVIRPAGRAVRGDWAGRVGHLGETQAFMGGQLGAIRSAGEQVGVDQAGREVVRGYQTGRQKQLGAIRQAGR